MKWNYLMIMRINGLMLKMTQRFFGHVKMKRTRSQKQVSQRTPVFPSEFKLMASPQVGCVFEYYIDHENNAWWSISKISSHLKRMGLNSFLDKQRAHTVRWSICKETRSCSGFTPIQSVFIKGWDKFCKIKKILKASFQFLFPCFESL